MNSQPGWYPDPQNPTIVRYWDGQQWTSQTQARSTNLARVSAKPPMTALTKVIWFLIALAAGVVALVVGTTVVANLAGSKPETVTIDDATYTQLMLRKDPTSTDPATYQEIDDRDLALIVKDPWANKDRRIVLYASIYQFDTITGTDRFLANVGTSPLGIGNSQNAQLVGTITGLESFVEGDTVKLHVVVDGEYQFTSSGKEIVVPQFQIGIIELAE